MKYLMIFLEGADASLLAAKKPNIDALAANGRVGVLNTKSADTVNTTLRLLGCHGSGSGEGKICLRCSPVSLDGDGNTGSIPASDEDISALAGAVEAMEIDGVKFNAIVAGRYMLVVMSGEGLSPDIIINRCSPGTPLPQIGAAKKQAKRTASTLNKLLYRLAKKHSISFIVADKAVRISCDFKRRSGLLGCLVSNDASVRAVAQCLGMHALDYRGADSVKLALEYHDFVFIHLADSIEKTDSELFRQIKDAPVYGNPVTVLIFAKTPTEPLLALVHGGGILPGREKRFSEAACARGFVLDTCDLLPWVMKATG